MTRIFVPISISYIQSKEKAFETATARLTAILGLASGTKLASFALVYCRFTSEPELGKRNGNAARMLAQKSNPSTLASSSTARRIL